MLTVVSAKSRTPFRGFYERCVGNAPAVHQLARPGLHSAAATSQLISTHLHTTPRLRVHLKLNSHKMELVSHGASRSKSLHLKKKTTRPDRGLRDPLDYIGSLRASRCLCSRAVTSERDLSERVRRRFHCIQETVTESRTLRRLPGTGTVAPRVHEPCIVPLRFQFVRLRDVTACGCDCADLHLHNHKKHRESEQTHGDTHADSA